MPRTLVGGLIQAAAPMTDPSAPIEHVRKAAIDAHKPGNLGHPVFQTRFGSMPEQRP